MKLKLDENMDARLIPRLLAEGFDADTVTMEKMNGNPDESIYETVKSLGRVLVTLDLDFSNPFLFPPDETEGIVVLRPPMALLPMIEATLASVIPKLKTEPIRGKLWIVEPGRIREFHPDDA